MDFKIDYKKLLIASGCALLMAVLLAYLNNTNFISRDLGAVIFIGFFSGSSFLLACAFMYKYVAKISVGWGFLGSLISIGLFFLVNLTINFFHDLNYLYQPSYNTAIWVYTLSLFYVSNVLSLFILAPFWKKKIERQKLIDLLTGRIN